MVRSLIAAAVLVSLAAMPAGASNAVSLGYSDSTRIVGPGTDACASGSLIHDHDGSFETGYAWQFAGVVPPYYGSLGEGYDLGRGTIACGAYWVSGLAGFTPPYSVDCYVWNEGVGSPPDAVLGVVTGLCFDPIPNWPTVVEKDVDLAIAVTGPFTVGYWGNWPGGMCIFYCGADLDGPPGHPWTCIAPGIGYPSGWQDPSVVWGSTSAIGCGVYFEQATPAESGTWGAIKALFR